MYTYTWILENSNILTELLTKNSNQRHCDSSYVLLNVKYKEYCVMLKYLHVYDETLF